jgi:hypothetical protein
MLQEMKEIADYASLHRLLMLRQIEKPMSLILSLILISINDTLDRRIAAGILKEPLLRIFNL